MRQGSDARGLEGRLSEGARLCLSALLLLEDQVCVSRERKREIGRQREVLRFREGRSYARARIHEDHIFLPPSLTLSLACALTRAPHHTCILCPNSPPSSAPSSLPLHLSVRLGLAPTSTKMNTTMRGTISSATAPLSRITMMLPTHRHPPPNTPLPPHTRLSAMGRNLDCKWGRRGVRGKGGEGGG